MDLNKEAIKNLEKLRWLRKRVLEFETWDVMNEMPVGSNKELAIYNLRRQENTLRMSEALRAIADAKTLIKNINKIEQIKIPLEKDMDFARIAQGSKISGTILPSGLVMYHRVDEYEWVIRGNFAVLESNLD